MKNYIIFSAKYLPSLGGVERYTYNLAKKLLKNGHKVKIVTSNSGDLENYELSDGVEIFRVPCINLLKGRFPILKINREYFKILKIIKSHNYDMCIVNTRFYVHSLFGVIFGSKHSKKTIVIEHGTNHFTVNNKILDIFGRIYEHMITFFIKWFCKEYYGVSESCNSWLRHFNIQARSTLHNAIDIDDINYLLKNSEISYRSEYNLPKDSIVIAYTGRLVREKGILKLISAINEINKINKRVYLFVAGDGNLMSEIKSIENKNIMILGKLTFDKVISLLKESDIFCLPTDYPEGFPTSVIEAVACGCFVITTSAGGSKELILNQDYGIILKENTINKLVEAINKAISDNKYMEKAKEKAYERCIKNFTWDIISEKVENL